MIIWDEGCGEVETWGVGRRDSDQLPFLGKAGGGFYLQSEHLCTLLTRKAVICRVRQWNAIEVYLGDCRIVKDSSGINNLSSPGWTGVQLAGDQT